MVMANKGETEKWKIEAIALQFLSSSHSTPAPSNAEVSLHQSHSSLQPLVT